MKGKRGDDEEELRERYALVLVGMAIGIVVGLAFGMILGGKLNLIFS